MNLIIEELKSILKYSPSEGCFYWKVNRRTAKAGDRAGWVNFEGYEYIQIKRKTHYIHRLVWLFETGVNPVDEIDHINGERRDNRFSNLREATRSENCKNVFGQKNNNSGLRGIHFYKGRNLTKRWYVQIRCDHKLHCVGYFLTKEEAVSAWNTKASELYGEFFRPQELKTQQAG